MSPSDAGSLAVFSLLFLVVIAIAAAYVLYRWVNS